MQEILGNSKEILGNSNPRCNSHTLRAPSIIKVCDCCILEQNFLEFPSAFEGEASFYTSISMYIYIYRYVYQGLGIWIHGIPEMWDLDFLDILAAHHHLIYISIYIYIYMYVYMYIYICR